MTAKTYTVRESEIERRWYVVDATDETLGRLATRIARVLEGKNNFFHEAFADLSLSWSHFFCGLSGGHRHKADSLKRNGLVLAKIRW